MPQMAILAGAVLGLMWALACARLYRRYRQAAWMAASSVTGCLFFLGLTVLITPKVEGAWWLAPLWLAVGVLLSAHLRAAERAAREIEEIEPQAGGEDPFGIEI